ncbi:peptidase inhibitor 16 [Plakobranchus ocellatus]|uniref:Peptidase inhibitor 16 n=1 Tax=Plakobranchus ocellatus TaxID=259542 RepID=A0AAV3ZSM5_9GAST|nr:peptidase inhibitor 16 [Plakobranchus ocellatus]
MAFLPLVMIQAFFVVTTVNTGILPGPENISERNITGRMKHRLRREISKNTTGYNNEEKWKILQQHNEYRRLQNSSNMLMMEWDNNLERLAQTYANRCTFEHSKHPFRSNVGGHSYVGENLAVLSYKFKLHEPAYLWYREIKDYNYSSNSPVREKVMIGHYTQIVWADSYALGCGLKFCRNMLGQGTIRKGYLVVCHYGPGGNYVGEKPFKKGIACSDCGKKKSYCDRGLCRAEPPHPSASPSQDGPTIEAARSDQPDGAGVSREETDTTGEPDAGGSREDTPTTGDPCADRSREETPTTGEPSADRSREETPTTGEPSVDRSRKETPTTGEPSVDRSRKETPTTGEPSAGRSREEIRATGEPDVDGSREETRRADRGRSTIAYPMSSELDTGKLPIVASNSKKIGHDIQATRMFHFALAVISVWFPSIIL